MEDQELILGQDSSLDQGLINLITKPVFCKISGDSSIKDAESLVHKFLTLGIREPYFGISMIGNEGSN